MNKTVGDLKAALADTEGYTAEDIDAPPQLTLDAIMALANHMIAAKADVVKNDEEGARLRAIVRDLEEKKIPDALTALGMKDFTLTDGTKLIVEEEIHCSVTGPKKDAAFAWLRATGNDAIIKRELSIRFGKGDDELATNAIKQIRGVLGETIPITDAENVHHSTLKSFIKECLRDGVEVPTEPFGIYKINRAILRSPKS